MNRWAVGWRLCCFVLGLSRGWLILVFFLLFGVVGVWVVFLFVEVCLRLGWRFMFVHYYGGGFSKFTRGEASLWRGGAWRLGGGGCVTGKCWLGGLWGLWVCFCGGFFGCVGGGLC